ncbi:MAG: alpha-ketoacid dehydrogenase subunit beta [Streptosporangiaceae bacterium]
MPDPGKLADQRTGSHLVAAVLRQELARDASVMVFGEDVGHLGGVFGTTRRLNREFGDERVFDTPISETAFIGMAIGAAQAGLRPVAELMFVDFAGVCFDQIANQMAKNHYMAGGRVRLPLVVRSAVGSIGSAAQHSQVLGATFAHFPGLKVVLPGSHGDLQRLLVTAVRDDDPVIFLEHKRLLKARVNTLPLNDALGPEEAVEPAPLGRLRHARAGTDVTIVTAGWMVQESLQAAEDLAGQGISAAVVDLRSLVPMDRDGLAEAASQASRLLVVDEDYTAYGMAGEVICSVAERLGPGGPRMARLGLDVPLPASRILEEEVLPGRRMILDAVTALVKE